MGNYPAAAAAGFAEEAEKPVDYKYYVFLFKKNLYIIITFVIVSLTLGGLYVSKLPESYKTKTQILIERPKVARESNQLVSLDEAQAFSAEYYKTQKRLMKHDTVLKQVVQDLKLETYFGRDLEGSANRLKRMVRVRQVGKSRLFDIWVQGKDPKVLAKIANAVARAFIKKNFEENIYYTKEILQWIPEGGKDTDVVTIETPLGGLKQMTRKELIENLPTIQTDPTVRELKKKIYELEANLELQAKQYREKHPVIVKAKANLRFLHECLEAEKRRIIEDLKAKAEGNLQMTPVRIIQEAEPPTRPLPVDRKKPMLMALAAGIVLPFVIILLLDFMDDTLHAFEDLERKGLMLPFLGPIPVVKATAGTKQDPSRRALAGYYDKASGIGESFRYLRVAINFSATPEALKNLVITSCLPSEGKSFVSHNIAVSLAQDGNRTLLIDGDMRRPKLDRVFRLDNSTGLSNFLTSNLELASVLKETFIENLMVITSGPMSPNPGEILASQRMKDLLENARAEFDRIIIDCPPLTGIGDGFVLGNLVGHCILVIAAGRTPADLIRHTQAQLDKAQVKIIGAVLNMVDMEKEKYRGYSKHYFHTYNRYYQVSETKGEL